MHQSDQQVAPKPQIALLTTDDRPLNKRFFLSDEGKIEKETRASLITGFAQMVTVETSAALLEVIQGLSERQAIGTGSMRFGTSGRVAPKARAGWNEISRSKDHFHHPEKPGWVLIDVDFGGMPEEVQHRVAALGGIREALRKVWPEANEAESLFAPSSSDGIIAPSGDETRTSGAHLYVLVSDVSKSREILTALRERAWRMGLAWWMISKSGALLERSIVDVSVASPERLIFEAPPLVEAPLKREVKKPVVSEGGFAGLDLGGNIDADQRRTEALRAASRAASMTAAQRVRQAYVRARAKAVSEMSGVAVEEAKQAIIDRLEGGILYDHDVLEMADGSTRVIGELLDELTKRHEAGEAISIAMPDPDSGVDYNPTAATLVWGARFNWPVLHSHAHGIEREFHFQRWMAPLQIEDARMKAKEAEAAAQAGLAAPREILIGASGEPSFPLATMTTEEGGRVIAEAAGDFLAGRSGQSALIRASLGSGKSYATVYAIVQHLRRQSEARVLFRVPTHQLAQQVADIFDGRGIEAVVWRGADQDDPRGNGLKMCMRSPEDRSAISAAGLKLEALCGSGKEPKKACPFNPLAHKGKKSACDLCLYRQQDFREARVVIVASDNFVTGGLATGIKRSGEDGPGGVADGVEFESADGEEKGAGELPHFDLAVLDETSPEAFVTSSSTMQLSALLTSFSKEARALGVEIETRPGAVNVMELKAALVKICGKLGKAFGKPVSEMTGDELTDAIGDMATGLGITFNRKSDGRGIKGVAFVLNRAARIAGVDIGEAFETVSIEEMEKTLSKLTGRISVAHRQGREFLYAGDIMTNSDLFGADKLVSAKAAMWRCVNAVEVEGVATAVGAELETLLASRRRLAAPAKAISRVLSCILQGMEDAGWSLDGSGEVNLDHRIDQLKFYTRKKAKGDDSEPGVNAEAERITLNCQSRAKVSDHILKARTLILDATPCEDILRRFFPRLELLADAQVKDGEGVTRVQLVGTSMSHTQIAPKAGSVHWSRQVENTIRLGTAASALKVALGGQSTLITPKATRDWLETRHENLISSISLSHLNGNRGSNAFSNTRSLIVAGRTSARVEEVERTAAIIFGAGVTRIQPDAQGNRMYPLQPTFLRMRGSDVGKATFSEQHPDPRVESVRWAIADAEKIQSAGRGRAVRRGKDNPLCEIHLSSTPTDQPVDVVWTQEHYKALTSYVGALLSLGVWPMGSGRARVIQAALQRFAEMDDGICMDGTPDDIAAIAAASDPAHTLRNMDRHPCGSTALRTYLTNALDGAFDTGSMDVNLFGIELTLSGWHKLRVKAWGGNWSETWIKASSEAEAVTRAQAILIACEVELAEVKSASAGEMRIERAISEHGFMFVSPRAAARMMPEIWPSEGAARRDLNGVGFSSKPLQSLTNIYSTKGMQRFCPKTDSIRGAGFRAGIKAISAGRKAIEVIGVAEDDADLRARIEAFLGEELTAFSVIEEITLQTSAADAPVAEVEIDDSDGEWISLEEHREMERIAEEFDAERAQRLEEREEEARRREWELRHPDGFEPSSLELKHFAELEQIRLVTLYGGLEGDLALGADADEGERNLVEVPAAIADVLAGRRLRLVVDNGTACAGPEGAVSAAPDTKEAQWQGDAGADRLGPHSGDLEASDHAGPRYAWERTTDRVQDRNPEPRKLYAWE